MTIQKILIAMSTEEELLPSLYAWGKRFDWSHVLEVHFLHIVKKNITPLEFGLMETPDEEAFQEMKPTLENYLKDESKKIIPREFQPQIFYHLLIDFYPDEETMDLIKAMHVDLVVVATHEHHSFFHRSFTKSMIKSSPCDVYVVRPEIHGETRAP